MTWRAMHARPYPVAGVGPRSLADDKTRDGASNSAPAPRGVRAVEPAGRRAGTYTRPLFTSTYALSEGYGVHSRTVEGVFMRSQGVCWVYFVSETAQVELKSGQV